MGYTARQKAKQPPNKEHWALEYFKKNPFKCIGAWLTFAGLFIIYAYEFHIEHSPKFDIKSFASVIFSAAYAELSSLIASSLLLFLPVYFVNWYARSKQQDREKTTQTILKGFVYSWLAFLLFCALVFVAVLYELPPSAPLLIAILVPLIYLLYKRTFARLPAHYHKTHTQPDFVDLEGYISTRRVKLLFLTCVSWSQENEATLKLAIFMFMGILMQVFPLQMYWITMRGAPSMETDDIDWFLIGRQIFTVDVILQGVGIYLVWSWSKLQAQPVHRAYSVFSFLCAPFLLTFLGGNPSFYPSNVAYLLKTGNFATLEITLSAAGCEVIAGETVKGCQTVPDGGRKIYGAFVMSNIGTETYLRVRSLNGKTAVPIYLKTEDVIGMKIDESKRFYNKQSVDKFLTAKSG